MTPALEQDGQERCNLAPVNDRLHWAEPQSLELHSGYPLENVFLMDPTRSKVDIVLYRSSLTQLSSKSEQGQTQPALVGDPQELRALLSVSDSAMLHRA